jgi:hypothetical protein
VFCKQIAPNALQEQSLVLFTAMSLSNDLHDMQKLVIRLTQDAHCSRWIASTAEHKNGRSIVAFVCLSDKRAR